MANKLATKEVSNKIELSLSAPKFFITASAILIAGAVVGWSIAQVFAPPAENVGSAKYSTVSVVSSAIGETQSLNVVAQWDQLPVGTNLAQGTVTSVIAENGTTVEQGQSLFEVNLRPVIVAEGSTPAFRDLSSGAIGEDVSQLQTMLTELRLYSGKTDGKFGQGTEQAVKSWQKLHEVDQDGVVRAGDIIYIPELPSRISLDTDTVERGSILGGGEQIASVLSVQPRFYMPVTKSQGTTIQNGMNVEIAGDASVWHAVVDAQEVDPENSEQVNVLLRSTTDEPICGTECNELPPSSESVLAAKVVIQPEIKGDTVPVAAVMTQAGGETVVVRENGDVVTVTVVASARGMAVVEGLEPGLRVRIPASVGELEE